MKDNTLAPIIIPTLCRYDHFKRCIESLAANKLASETELYIGLDYPPSERYEDGWKKIKEYIPTIQGFKRVVTLEASKNLTAQGNIEALKNHIRQLGYESYIFTEDDNVFSPNFLEYANWGLREFENDNTIFAIVGFKRVNVEFLRNNVYKYPRYVAWGIATWFDRVDKIDKFKDFERLSHIVRSYSPTIIFSDKLNIARSIIRMIKNQYILEDTLPSLLSSEELFCIYPKVSMVRNMGFDGSGLHGGNNDTISKLYQLIPLDDKESFMPHIEEPLYNKNLKKAYKFAYKKSFRFSAWLVGAFSFLVFRYTGLFWRVS